jgi:hypothetical protein
MSITAIRATFPDEWVAAIVTEVDPADVPVAGMVLTHSPEQAIVYSKVKTHLATTPMTRLFICFTGEPMAAGIGVMGALC